ncbi:MAG TPA: SPFH domain-containing protein [Frateuria sp.]|uniref:SPFH domain-containing protein n=1 Tax=Frateuria sp. TaxID=2211372 RepID=UPI002DE6D58A|nr:SPFH domain-containing protein [Frateuria sp.]
MTVALLTMITCLALIAGAVKRVPEGRVHSVYRHGKLQRLLQPGVHFVLPGLERVGHRIDLAGQILRFQEPLAASSRLHGTVYWQVLEPERADAVIDQAEQLIRGGTLDALKAEPDVAQENRRDLGSRLKQRLNAVLRERGVIITRVELDFA